MTTYRISTEADSRSKSRQSRTWTITAENLDDARYEARHNHVRIVGWNASVWITREETI